MVGKNNKKVQDQKNAPKVTRYGLRKMSFGVASVALGSLLFIGPTPTAVSAAEVDQDIELVAEQTEVFTYTFKLKDDNGEYNVVSSGNYDNLTRAEFEEVVNILAEIDSEAYGTYTFSSVDNDYTFFFEGLVEEEEEVEEKEDFTLSFRLKDEDGNYNEVASYVYDNLTRAEFEAIANDLAEIDSEAYGAYSFASADNDYTFYFEGLPVEEEVEEKEDFTLSFRLKDEDGNYNEVASYVYDNLTRAEFEEIANALAEVDSEAYGVYSSTSVDNAYTFYFEGLPVEEEVEEKEDFTLKFRLKDEDGNYNEVASYVYENLTREEFEAIANDLAEVDSEAYGAYSFASVDNDYTFYFEGLPVEEEVKEDFTLTFRLKDEDGNYNEVASYVYENLTREEFEAIANDLAEVDSEAYGAYSFASVDNDYTFYFEGLPVEEEVKEDFTLSFKVKDENGNYNEVASYVYENLTRAEFEAIANALAEVDSEAYGVYSFASVDNDYTFYFEGLAVEEEAKEDFTLSFKVKDENGNYNEVASYVYENLTRAEFEEIANALAEVDSEAYGVYSFASVDNDYTFYFEGLAVEEEAKEDFTLSFKVKDENGNYNEVASYVYENLTRAEFEEIANILAEVDSEAYGAYSFASVDNDYTFYFEGLSVEEEVKEDYTLTFEVMNPDGTVTFIQESEYVNMTRDQMLEISALIAEANKATYGDYTIVENGNHWTFTYEGLEAEEVREDFTLSFRVKDENGNYNEVASYVYENLTRAEFEEIANVLAEVDSEAYGVYSYTIVDNAYVYYFEGTESEVPVGEDYTLTFEVMNPDGTVTLIQESEYVNMTRDQMLEISALIAEGNKATYGDYTIVENGNHWTFTYEGLEAEEVREDFTLSFRVKDENGNYNEVASYVYENLTRAEFEEIANILAEVDSEAYGVYSYTSVDNDYIFYFEGLSAGEEVKEDYTLTFQVKNPDGTITFIQESEYVNMTRDEMVEISAIIAEGNKATYGDYTIVENGNHWIFTYEGLGEEIPVGNDYFLSFEIKNEDGEFEPFLTYNYENMTEEEMMELAIALADFQTEFHGSYELVKDGNNWTFYFEGLKNSIPWIPLEPSTPIKPDVPLTPLEPSTPIKPDVPLTPLEPSTPIVPETPETPEVPEVPETPETPETPEVPEVPETPEMPETPETPEMPETPTTPEKPNDSAETEGEKLPVTSTAVWSLGLAGLVSVVGGAGAEAIRRKKK